MIICISGPSCAGKSTAAEYLSDEYGIDHLEASDFVRRRFESQSEFTSIMEFVKSEFKNKGKDTFAKDVVNELELRPSGDQIIAGYRAAEEIQHTKKELGCAGVLGIYSNSQLRFQRKLKRDDPPGDYEYIQFVNKDFQEYKFGINSILQQFTDDLIINEGTRPSLRDELDKVISDLI